jgi:hypothetical protein
MQVARDAQPLVAHRKPGELLSRCPQFAVDADHASEASHDGADRDDRQRPGSDRAAVGARFRHADRDTSRGHGDHCQGRPRGQQESGRRDDIDEERRERARRTSQQQCDRDQRQ